MLTRLLDYEKIISTKGAPVVFVERSIFSDKNVFMENFSKNGIATEAEIAVYNEWCNFSVKKINYEIDAIIYLRATPETCMSRC
jgi:deoxyadenosine/deoxycytidine kinase